MKLRTYSFGFWGQSRNRKETIIESLATINSYCTNDGDLLKLSSEIYWKREMRLINLEDRSQAAMVTTSCT